MDEAAPTPPTLPQTVHRRLIDAPAPLLLKAVTKGLAKAGKKTSPPDFATLLADEVRAGRAFKFPSGAEGADRYWARDEREVAREAVRTAGAEPKKLPDLKKVAKDATKADKAFAEALVDDMVAAGQLHEYPGKKPLYGREKPPARNDKAKVSEALLAAAGSPAKLADLIKTVMAAVPADKDFVASVANELIAGGQLHKQAGGKAAPYGRQRPEPPHPLETGKGKTAFGKLVADARKLLAGAGGVAASDLLERLRVTLDAEHQPRPAPAPAAPDKEPSTAPAPTVQAHQPHPRALTPEAIRTGLKAAYEELRRDVEFQDGPVELRALFHEAAQSLPALTADQFHRELLHLQQHRAVELQPLNEVQRAEETGLAIRSGDRLLYFVLWR